MNLRNGDKIRYKNSHYLPMESWTHGSIGIFIFSVETNQLENQLNLLGYDGWEMVSCTSTNQSYGSSKSIVCVFKRNKDQ
jgi:hypothetical protein